MKFLVVDDHKTMRRILTAHLDEMGFNDVEEAEDGAVALQKLRQGGFDFVISDWNMPNMTGVELLQAVRGDAQLKNLPFILVSAESQWGQISQAIHNNVSEYVIKPFHTEDLEKKIRKCLSALAEE